MNTEHVIHLDDSTLGDLRRLLASVESLPDDSEVRVRTRRAFNPNGGLVERVHIEEAKRT